jgi:hypothetical protein
LRTWTRPLITVLLQVVECIQRTLTAVEARDGQLPKILFFQADNSFRESKNTYQVAYFAMLVERKVFDVIYLSFHPKGHTHNECDQCASRMSLGVRNQTILCRCQFNKVLKDSFSPTPVVQYLDRVADFKSFVNPSGMPGFPVGKNPADQPGFDGSHVKAAVGINDSQLFKFQRDRTGRPLVHTKETVDDLHWSEGWAPFRRFPCGLNITDLKGSLYKEVAPERLRVIRKTVEAHHRRMNTHQQECCDTDMEFLETAATDPDLPLHWHNKGKFIADDLDSDEDVAFDSEAESEAVYVRRFPALGKSQVVKRANKNRELVAESYVTYNYKFDENHRPLAADHFEDPTQDEVFRRKNHVREQTR